MLRLALISVHGCPIIQAGEKDTGGMNVYVMETARRLAARGVQVDVFTRRHDPRDPQVVQLAPGARLIHLCAGPASTGKEDIYELLPEFCDELIRFCSDSRARYDVVSTHYWLSGLVGLELQKRWDIPHVTSYHTLAEVKRRARPGEQEPPRRAESERKIAQRADLSIVWSPHERDAVVKYYGGDARRVAIIPPGVDSVRFRPVDQWESRLRLGLGNERLLLYVGRLERLKGVDILLRAMSSLEHAAGVRLFVVGGSDNSPELTRLQNLASELGQESRVSFLGSVTQDQLPYYYNAADVCVLPSYYESFGLAALEAAACGKPVVASRVGGLPSVVRDGRTGYLISWRCPGPFVDRLELLITNDRLRRDMGAAARIHAETLTWDVAADRLLEVFNEMAAEATVGSCAAAGD